jgi:hypothetical protein
MASQGPPEEEHVENGRGLLVLLMNAIDALGFNSHFLIKPFLSSAHAAEKSFLLLEFARPDHLLGLGLRRRLVCGGSLPFDIVALRLDIVGVLGIVRMPHIGLVAVNKVRHCCETEQELGGGKQDSSTFSAGEICAGGGFTFCTLSADEMPSRRQAGSRSIVLSRFPHGGAQGCTLPPDNDAGRDGKAKMVHWSSMIRHPWQNLIRKVHRRLAAELWDAGCVRLIPLDGDAVWPQPNCQTRGTPFATRGDESSCIAESQLGGLMLLAKASFDDR